MTFISAKYILVPESACLPVPFGLFACMFFSVHISVSSVCFSSVCLSFCTSACLDIFLFVRLFVCNSVCL